jgi:DNA polymerase III delta prime subunit
MIGVNMEEFLWVQKYRPHTVQDTILPKDLKDTFQKFVDDKNVPNLLLSGRAGVGKTTIARAMLDELGADYIIINGSMNGNIDTLRVDIQNFASTVSFMGGRKYVILDEADYLNANSTQPALRNFMEEFSKNCGFILTCNFANRIIEPLHSRCSVVNFNINAADRPKMASQFFKRTLGILDAEGIQYEQKAVAELINTYFPDWRRVLNELQRYAATGRIDAGILRNKGSESIESLIALLKDKRFNEVRKWIGENSDIDSSTLYRSLYDIIPNKIASTSSIANAIIILAEYEYKEAFVANPEINRAAAMATLMAEVSDWK